MNAPAYESNAEIHTQRRDTEVGMAIGRHLGGLLAPRDPFTALALILDDGGAR